MDSDNMARLGTGSFEAREVQGDTLRPSPAVAAGGMTRRTFIAGALTASLALAAGFGVGRLGDTRSSLAATDESRIDAAESRIAQTAQQAMWTASYADGQQVAQTGSVGQPATGAFGQAGQSATEATAQAGQPTTGAIAQASGQVEMPDLVGDSLNVALGKLEVLGIPQSRVDIVVTDGKHMAGIVRQENWRVNGQSIAAHTAVGTQDSVTLYVEQIINIRSLFGRS